MLSPSISKLRDELIEYLQDMDCVTASEVGFVAGYMDAMWALQEPEEAESKSNYDLEDKYSNLALKLRDSLNNIVGGHAWSVSFIPEIVGNRWHGANYVAHYNGVHGFWDITVGYYGNDSYEMDTMDISAMKNIVWSQHQMIVNEKHKQPVKASQDVLAAERDTVVKMVKQELDAATGQSWDVDWQLVNYPSIGDFDITCHCAMSNGIKLGKRYDEYNLNTMSVLDIAKEVVAETLEFYTISTHRHRSSYMNTMVPEVKRILTEKTQETWDIDWRYNTTHTWVIFNLRGVVSGTHRVDVNDNMDKQVESVVNAIYNDYIYKVKRHDESQNAKTS